MTATNETTVDSASLRALQDRTDIADVLYRYASGVDSFDSDGIRSALADDIWAQYGNGDHAKTLSYLSSYQVFEENPDAAIILVARYHDELKRTPAGWKISKRIMELLWGESKADEGYLASLWGRGPKIWQRS